MTVRNEKFGTFDCNLALLRKNLRMVKTNGWIRSCVIFKNCLDSNRIAYTNRGYYVLHNHGTGTVVDKICYLLDFGPYDRAALFSVQQDLRLRGIDEVCGFLGALDVYLTSYGKMSSTISAGWVGIKGGVVRSGVDIESYDKTLPDYVVEMMEAFFNDGGNSVHYKLDEKDVPWTISSGEPDFRTCSCLMSGHTGVVRHTCGK